MISAVKFHGEPLPDTPRSGWRRRRRPPPWVTVFLHFSVTPGRPIPPFHHFWTLLTHTRGPFLQIPHSLKDTTKTKLADCWIEFFGHHNNLWTKLRLLMCSWSLGLSVDIWFVNFGRRLVSFQFLGHLG